MNIVDADQECREVRSYTDHEGREVMALLKVDMETLQVSSENALFKGKFAVATNLGPMGMSFDFPMGYTLEKCFEDFDQFAEETVEEKKRETEDKNRIMTPDQAKASGIIVP